MEANNNKYVVLMHSLVGGHRPHRIDSLCFRVIRYGHTVELC